MPGTQASKSLEDKLYACYRRRLSPAIPWQGTLVASTMAYGQFEPLPIDCANFGAADKIVKLEQGF
jgi:hypothetical protein